TLCGRSGGLRQARAASADQVMGGLRGVVAPDGGRPRRVVPTTAQARVPIACLEAIQAVIGSAVPSGGDGGGMVRVQDEEVPAEREEQAEFGEEQRARLDPHLPLQPDEALIVGEMDQRGTVRRLPVPGGLPETGLDPAEGRAA